MVGNAVDKIVESSAHNMEARHKPGKMAQNLQPFRVVGLISGMKSRFPGCGVEGGSSFIFQCDLRLFILKKIDCFRIIRILAK